MEWAVPRGGRDKRYALHPPHVPADPAEVLQLIDAGKSGVPRAPLSFAKRTGSFPDDELQRDKVNQRTSNLVSDVLSSDCR